MPSRPDFADVPLAAKDRAAVLEAAQVLCNHLPVDRVVLYGSKARGDDQSDSDIDLLILTTRPVIRVTRDARALEGHRSRPAICSKPAGSVSFLLKRFGATAAGHRSHRLLEWQEVKTLVLWM